MSSSPPPPPAPRDSQTAASLGLNACLPFPACTPRFCFCRPDRTVRSACITCQGQTRTARTKERDQKKAYPKRRHRLQWGTAAPAALPIPAPPAAPAPPTADANPAARRPVMDRHKCMRSGRCDSADSVGMASLCAPSHVKSPSTYLQPLKGGTTAADRR